MSKIDDLIGELCPSGVPLHSLPTLARIDRGLTYSKSDEDPQGSVAVLRSNNIDQTSNTVSLIDTKRLRSDLIPNPKTRLGEGDILLSAASGSRAHVGKVAFISKDPGAYFGGFMMAIRAGELIEARYLFHILTSGSFREYLDQSLSSSTINNINASVLEGFRLPVPPLELQREIVSILDKFTQLEAELEAELEARRIQYEATRDRLIGSSGDLESHSIESRVPNEFIEAGTLVRLSDLVKTLIPVGKIPRSQFQQDGLFPIVDQSQALIAGYTDDESIVNDFGPCVVFGDHTREIKYVDFRFAAGADGTVVLLPTGDLSARFLFYSLQSLRIQSRGYNRHWSAVKELQISIPSQQRQAQIVAILDKLYALANDISMGLPAEISARRKQYEYYRNKLLTFKELETA